jgi:glycosyltransferase involved in cell wall biosynthesis
MVGTRGVPARYGGFETAIEHIGRRLVERGNRVTVYCRGNDDRPSRHVGMELVHLPALRLRAGETLSHSALSLLHLQRHRPDVAFVFNAANAPLLPLLHLARVPFATHVDGLEWRRAKWGRSGRAYYQRAEWLSVHLSPAIIADAEGIAAYYQERYRCPSELIAYGAPIIDTGADRLIELGLDTRRFHLVVARFEPENNVVPIVKGYRESDARWPLVVVGSAPYAAAYRAAVERAAAGDDRIRLLGAVWDDELLDQLYGNCATYLHGHSVGGTNPSLLRAMGAGAPVVAFDCVFNREVAGDTGCYFERRSDVAAALENAERDADAAEERGHRGRDRARARYNWDDVTTRYEVLARKLVAGHS